MTASDNLRNIARYQVTLAAEADSLDESGKAEMFRREANENWQTAKEWDRLNEADELER